MTSKRLSMKHVYEARLSWLKCEAIGKNQELGDVKKSREHCQQTMQNLCKREELIQYSLKKIDQEIEELAVLLQNCDK